MQALVRILLKKRYQKVLLFGIPFEALRTTSLVNPNEVEKSPPPRATEVALWHCLSRIDLR